MARTSNPSPPGALTSAAILEQVARDVRPNYIPEPGEHPEPDSMRARYEREAEALSLYWEHLVREMRSVDRRLDELAALLN